MKNLHRLLPAVAIISLLASTTVLPHTVPSAGLAPPFIWEEPEDLASRDLFTGPWGAQYAPDPTAVYTFVRPKQGGRNPGVVVTDPLGRTWHVKQSKGDHIGDESPVELVVSRVLSAVGYHQPPVYFLPTFTMQDKSGQHVEPGGRMRLDDETLLKNLGEWSWKDNPFVGTQPYKGLLAILLVFNSPDLKTSNNTIYEAHTGELPETWYVVRDLGSALGESGSLRPKRNNLALFERYRFITGLEDDFVKVDYHGKQPELIRRQITTADMRWAMALLGRLSDQQWADAFRAGGYTEQSAAPFIRKIKANIAMGQQVGRAASGVARPSGAPRPMVSR
jgi:hypothetical protein